MYIDIQNCNSICTYWDQLLLVHDKILLFSSAHLIAGTCGDNDSTSNSRESFEDNGLLLKSPGTSLYTMSCIVLSGL